MKDFAKFVFTSWEFMLICKLKLRKSLMKIFSVFGVSVLELKLRFAEKGKVKITVGNKMIAGVGLEPNHVLSPCCETWQKYEI